MEFAWTLASFKICAKEELDSCGAVLAEPPLEVALPATACGHWPGIAEGSGARLGGAREVEGAVTLSQFASVGPFVRGH